MAAEARIAKNTTYLTAASIVQKIISFGYYAFLARAIGEELLGQYDFALKFTSVFIIFMDFGLGPLLTREAAKDEKKLHDLFQRVLSLKIILIVLSLIAMVVSINVSELLLANVTPQDVMLVYCGGIVIVLDTLTFTFFSVFRAKKELQWEALGIILYQTSILVAGFAALYMGLPLIYIVGALACGSAVQFIYFLLLMRNKAGVSFKFTWDLEWAKKFLMMAAPFAFAGVIFRLNGTADSLMLKAIAGDSATGWYGLAFKLAFALTVLPGAFATSYFPAMSYYYKNAREKLHEAFEQGFFYMMVLSFPIMAGVFVLGDNIILRVWTEAYEASIEPLMILMLALPFVFLNYPIGNFLNAVDRQKLNTINMGIALLVNIALNFVLIPNYSFNGAALAVVASSATLVLLGLPWVYKIAPFRVGFLLKKMLLVGLSAAMMGGVVYAVQDNYSLVLLIAIGGLLYTGASLATNAVSQKELELLIGGIKKKVKRT